MHTDGIVPGGTGCAFSRCTNELATIFMYIYIYIYITNFWIKQQGNSSTLL